MPVYICNIEGDSYTVLQAEGAGFLAYYVKGVCAVEVIAHDKSSAAKIAARFGHVLCVFV